MAQIFIIAERVIKVRQVNVNVNVNVVYTLKQKVIRGMRSMSIRILVK